MERTAEAAASGTAARDGGVGRNSGGSLPLTSRPRRYMRVPGAVATTVGGRHDYCISEESRPHYGGCGSGVECCACAVAKLRAGAAWEHVIAGGRALAAVEQLAGRWLRKRNIHFRDLMFFLLDAMRVLDLIFGALEGVSPRCPCRPASSEESVPCPHPPSPASHTQADPRGPQLPAPRRLQTSLGVQIASCGSRV